MYPETVLENKKYVKVNSEFLDLILEGCPYMVFTFEDAVFTLVKHTGYADKNFAYSFFSDESGEWISIFEKQFLVLDRIYSSSGNAFVYLWLDSLSQPSVFIAAEVKSADQLLLTMFRLAVEGLTDPQELPWFKEALRSDLSNQGNPVLIMGEPGLDLSGLCAKLVKPKSGRMDEIQSFHPGRLSNAVQLREIFGDHAGARLGDSASAVPLVKRDNGVNIIINEVGDLAYEVQERMADFLLSSSGANQHWYFLSTRDLPAMVESGEFSYRLYEILKKRLLVVPPLRLYKKELPDVITKYLLYPFQQKYRRNISLSREAMDYISEHDWPGNWEELKSVIEEAFLTCKGNEILYEDIRKGPGRESREDADDLNLRKRTMELERQLMLEAHALHGGNQVHMARALGISRGSLQYKMEKFGLI
jgi:transcriptional regulator of acetoin/glycerol metabolism